MPTGYTAAVSDGTVTDFNVFALQCARAFGALIEMRDDPNDAPIPAEFKPSTYHLDRLSDAKRLAGELLLLTPDQAALRANDEYVKAMADHERYAANRLETRNRYNAMLAQVVAWTPPSPDHEELKRFMLQQLHDSLKFDCAEPASDWTPKRREWREWLDASVAAAQKDITRHEQEWENDCRRARERTQWVQKLRESLSALTVK